MDCTAFLKVSNLCITLEAFSFEDPSLVQSLLMLNVHKLNWARIICNSEMIVRTYLFIVIHKETDTIVRITYKFIDIQFYRHIYNRQTPPPAGLQTCFHFMTCSHYISWQCLNFLCIFNCYRLFLMNLFSNALKLVSYIFNEGKDMVHSLTITIARSDGNWVNHLCSVHFKVWKATAPICSDQATLQVLPYHQKRYGSKVFFVLLEQ